MTMGLLTAYRARYMVLGGSALVTVGLCFGLVCGWSLHQTIDKLVLAQLASKMTNRFPEISMGNQLEEAIHQRCIGLSNVKNKDFLRTLFFSEVLGDHVYDLSLDQFSRRMADRMSVTSRLAVLTGRYQLDYNDTKEFLSRNELNVKSLTVLRDAAICGTSNVKDTDYVD